MTIKKGQIYKSNDPRRNSRKNPRKVLVLGFTDKSRQLVRLENLKTGRITVSSLEAFGDATRGFTLFGG